MSSLILIFILIVQSPLDVLQCLYTTGNHAPDQLYAAHPFNGEVSVERLTTKGIQELCLAGRVPCLYCTY